MYNVIIVKPFLSYDSFPRETRNDVLNRCGKQAIKNFFLLFPANTLLMEWNVCISWTRESQLIFRRTQLNVKLSNATFYIGENTLWRILSVLMSLFRFPRLNDYASWNKLQVRKRTFMLAVSAVFCLTDLNNSIPNDSLIVAKGKWRKNTNLSLQNLKK